MNIKNKILQTVIIVAALLFLSSSSSTACGSSDKIYSSDSIISAIEQIVQSNFFLPEKTKNGKNNDTELLVSDLILEYHLTELNKNSVIDLEYNIHVKDYIRKYTMERKENVSALLSLSKFYFPIFEDKLKKYRLPDELKYLAVIESSLNPLACSKSGAIGLWQFLYDTGKMFDLEMNSFVDNRHDPTESTEAACKYLTDLYNTFNDWHLALAAYNGGPGTVRYAIKKAKGVRDYWSIRQYLPEQTQNYVPAFIAANYIMSYAENHNIYPNSSLNNYLSTDTISISRDLHFSSISETLNMPVSVIKFLNPTYTKNIIPGSNELMTLILPLDKKQEFFEKQELIISKERSLQDATEKLERDLSKNGKHKISHIVERDEIIDSIAEKYDCMIMEIVNWNHLIFEKVHIGQELTVWVDKRRKRKRID